jgi:hypothetical protein
MLTVLTNRANWYLHTKLNLIKLLHTFVFYKISYSDLYKARQILLNIDTTQKRTYCQLLLNIFN